MKPKAHDFTAEFLAWARHSLLHHSFPRIAQCLKLLTPDEIWWRPHRTSNSVGNLVLHLSGNVRQWIISGLGGAPDTRRRDEEFAARGGISRRVLLIRLRNTLAEASGVIKTLSARDLARTYPIQGFEVTGFEAVSHVVEHFAHHTGQIIFATKLKRGEDLGFTRLPGERKRDGKKLPPYRNAREQWAAMDPFTVRMRP